MTDAPAKTKGELPNDVCALCGKYISVPDDLEPTEICNLCAQDKYIDLQRALEAAKSEHVEWTNLHNSEVAKAHRARIAAEKALEAANSKLEAANARIDALMLEYCPDEMTVEQMRVYADHQISAAKGEE